jgi:hypothetical protein
MDDAKTPAKLNWVERRFQRQRLLHTEAPELWNQIRGAIQDNCESFNRIYAVALGAGQQVFCNLENGQRIRIHRTVPATSSFEQPKRLETLVYFREADHTISITSESGSRAFYMDADIRGMSVFISANRSGESGWLSPDQIAERVLEGILFPRLVRDE